MSLINTDWMPAKDVSISIGGVVQALTDAEYSAEVGTFDATTLKGGGFYDEGTDVKKVSLRGSILVDRTAGYPDIKAGTRYLVTWTETGGETHSGTWRCSKRSKKAAPKGGFVLSVEGVFNGAVVDTAAVAPGP